MCTIQRDETISIDFTHVLVRDIDLYWNTFLGSGKSTPVNYIKTAMSQLIELFPDVYNKRITTNERHIKTGLDSQMHRDDKPTYSTQSDEMNTNVNNSIDNKKKKAFEERIKIIVNFDTELALFRQMALVCTLSMTTLLFKGALNSTSNCFIDWRLVCNYR